MCFENIPCSIIVLFLVCYQALVCAIGTTNACYSIGTTNACCGAINTTIEGTHIPTIASLGFGYNFAGSKLRKESVRCLNDERLLSTHYTIGHTNKTLK